MGVLNRRAESMCLLSRKYLAWPLRSGHLATGELHGAHSPISSPGVAEHCRIRHKQPYIRNPGAGCLPDKGEAEAAITVSLLAS